MLKRLSGLSGIQRAALVGVTVLALVGLIGSSLLIVLPKLAQAQARAQRQSNPVLVNAPFAHMSAAQVIKNLANYNTIPLWHGSFPDSPYVMLGTNPVKGGVATIPIEIIPVTVKIGSAIFDGASRVNQVVNSPLFQLSDYPDGRAQYLDAVQRGNWWHYAHTNNYHLLLGAPTIEPTLSLTVPSADGTVTGQAASVSTTWWTNAIQAALAQRQTSPKVLPIFLTRNLYFGNQLGLYGYATQAQTSNLNFYLSASYFDCLERVCPQPQNGYIGPAEQDVLALSQTLVEFSFNPFGLNSSLILGIFADPYYDPATPNNSTLNYLNLLWQSPLAWFSSCFSGFDPLVATLDSSFTASTTVGGVTRLYHLSDAGYTSWFFSQSPSLGYGGHHDFMQLHLFDVYGTGWSGISPPLSGCCEVFCDAAPPGAGGSHAGRNLERRILTH